MMKISDVTEDFLRSLDIHTVLPQQEPFVMVDTLTHFGMTSSATEMLVRDSCIFVDEGYFSPYGIMENIAQTCASRIGFYNKYILGKNVQIGYIGAIRDYLISGKAPVGSVVSTVVDVVEEVFGMILASAEVRCNGKLIATAQVKLAVKNLE